MAAEQDPTLELKALLAEIGRMLDRGESGGAMVRRLCLGVDALITDLWRRTAGPLRWQVDLLAVGGYGRGELCPYSDWDLWFLCEEKRDAAVEAAIERFVYALWDMNAKLGHAVRSPDETMTYVRNDWNTATAAMESRLLCGSGVLYRSLQKKVDAFFARRRKAFVRAKLAEMERRHLQAGDTAFLMEPDIKEGKGGLRDVQTVFWMAKAWYGSKDIADLVRRGAISEKEYEHLSQAQDFLWRCRVALHLESGRGTNRLGFEQQVRLAQRLGYADEPHRPAVEVFMKDYFRHAGRIARVSGLLAMHFQEELHPQWLARRRHIGDGFVLEGKWLGVRDGRIFEEDPLRLLRIFHAAQKGHRRLASSALRQVREHVLLIDESFRTHAEACRIFLAILKEKRNVAAAMKEMNDTGVLGRFIPEFRHAVGLGQFNNYHAYTVDEHTIRAIAEARNMHHREREERLPLAVDVFQRLQRPELLYLALLFHDIAKGLGGDHSRLGAEIAERTCRRLGLDMDATALVTWLVRHHLLMAVTSQRSDLSDPLVIKSFAERVGDPVRLRYLLCLTVADIAAVGPNVWNDWKGTLLKELYESTERFLMGEETLGTDLRERVLIRIASALEGVAATEKPVLLHALEKLPWRAVLDSPPQHLLHIARTMVRAKDGFAVGVLADRARGESLVIILARDRRRLFADLAAAIASAHINILAAQAYALKDAQVLDVFHIQSHGGPLHEPHDLERLQQRIRKAVVEGAVAPVRPPRAHVLMRQVPVRARLLPLASSRQTAIEVTAADRPGLLAMLAAEIDKADLNIRGASISTFGERAVDVFFLTHRDGSVLTPEEVRGICERLARAARLPQEA